jgi:hypothetical protein
MLRFCAVPDPLFPILHSLIRPLEPFKGPFPARRVAKPPSPNPNTNIQLESGMPKITFRRKRKNAELSQVRGSDPHFTSIALSRAAEDRSVTRVMSSSCSQPSPVKE